MADWHAARHTAMFPDLPDWLDHPRRSCCRSARPDVPGRGLHAEEPLRDPGRAPSLVPDKNIEVTVTTGP